MPSKLAWQHQPINEREFDGAHKEYVAALEMDARNAAQNIIARNRNYSPEYLALLAVNLSEHAKGELAKKRPPVPAEQPRDESSGRFVPNTGDIWGSKQ